MPDISVSSQIFDVTFHPTQSVVYSALLSGEVKAFSYDDQGGYESKFSVWPSKKSCRGLDVSADGSQLWAVGKSKALYTIDTSTGAIAQTRKSAHGAAINRVKRLTPNLFATGDDDGVVKLWDPRQEDATRTYTHHFDFISDFLWLEDKKHLVCTSGDGTLSVLDVRSKKTAPFAQSEDQEDELLSIVAIKGGQKLVIGTQLGILTVFNRRSGYADCVDRVPGHPHSIDALSPIPSRYPNSASTILTGSSDGLVRVVELLPSKLVGVVADHGEFPVERVRVDREGEGHWVGSVGHEEVLKLTDLREVFEDGGSENEQEDKEDSEREEPAAAGGDEYVDDEHEEEAPGLASPAKPKMLWHKSTAEEEDGSDDSDASGDTSGHDDEESTIDAAKNDDSASDPDASAAKKEIKPSATENTEPDGDSDSDDSDAVTERKRKRKKDKDPFKALKKSKGRNELEADASFFADL